MDVVFLIAVVLVLLGAGIVFFGAPFVPTKKAQIKSALGLLELTPGSTLYDLGAGDGRVAVAAARRGVKVVAYELNIFLVLLAIYRTKKYRNLVSVKWGNYWKADISQADGIFIFSAEAFMPRLHRKILKANKRIRLASFAFQIPGVPAIKEKAGVYLYQYPIAEKKV